MSLSTSVRNPCPGRAAQRGPKVVQERVAAQAVDRLRVAREQLRRDGRAHHHLREPASRDRGARWAPEAREVALNRNDAKTQQKSFIGKADDR